MFIPTLATPPVSSIRIPSTPPATKLSWSGVPSIAVAIPVFSSPSKVIVRLANVGASAFKLPP